VSIGITLYLVSSTVRRRKAARRGGGARTISLDGDTPELGTDPDLVLGVDAALERLAREDPTSAEVARHRLFAGLSIDEVAEALGISRATAFREWAYARSWLATALDARLAAALEVVLGDLAIPDLEPVAVLVRRRRARPGDQLDDALKLFRDEGGFRRPLAPIGPGFCSAMKAAPPSPGSDRTGLHRPRTRRTSSACR
jgi:hypothetical protein